jgi:hypothetical protein
VDEISKQKVEPGQGRVSMKLEDGSFTAITDVTTDMSLCSVFVSAMLAPSADGTFALQCSNQDGGDATGPKAREGELDVGHIDLGIAGRVCHPDWISQDQA